MIETFIKLEAKKLQAQYASLYNASAMMPWNSPIRKTLRPLFEENNFKKREVNEIAQAFLNGFGGGFNVGIWYAALSPELNPNIKKGTGKTGSFVFGKINLHVSAK